MVTTTIVELYKNPLPSTFGARQYRPFTRRREAFKSSFQSPNIPDVLRTAAEELSERMAPLKTARDELMHAMAMTLADERVWIQKKWPARDALSKTVIPQELAEIGSGLATLNGDLEQFLIDIYQAARQTHAPS
jgi:hypothetical protein